MNDGRQKPASSIQLTWSMIGRLLLVGTPFLIVVGVTFYLVQSLGPEGLQQLIAGAGPLAPVVYVAIRIATTVFAPLSSGPLQISSGVGFGLWGGVFYSLLGEVLGGSIAFLISRHLGRPMVRYFVGDDGMEQVERFASQVGGWKALAYARVFLFSVYDFVTYGAGLTSIRFRTYLLVTTTVGIIPTFLIVAFGATMAIDGFTLMLAYGIAAVVPVLFAVLRKPVGRLFRAAPTVAQPEAEG
jgi:uncharacterized membrane protein YdjX (TVP38/TMEM64 family)